MTAGFDPKIRARALALLFLAGATIGAISILLPHSDQASEVGLWSSVALAYIVGFGLLFYGARLPTWFFHAVVAAGALLVARAIVLSGEEVSFYSVWFIWIGLFAFYFFERVAAFAHVAFVALVYGATLVDEPGSSPVARWITTVLTLLAAGLMIDALVSRVRRQAAAAEESARSMTMVAEVAHELARLSDSAAAGPALCEAARRLVRADNVALWVPSEDGTMLDVGASAGNVQGKRSLPFVGPTHGALTAFSSAECVREHEDGTSLWQPVLHDGVARAVLSFRWTSPDALRERSVVSLTDLLAAEAAVTLERVSLLSRLEIAARTDDLTGLPNRRSWQEVLPREIARAAREGSSLCVAMLDLDRFKGFNDEHGHQAGDRYLKQAAAAWNAQLRDTDLLARYGGEEFTLALPGCPDEGAFAVVERLRSSTPPGLTCSAGVVCWQEPESPADLLGRADAALYEAKNSGRDRTVLAPFVEQPK